MNKATLKIENQKLFTIVMCIVLLFCVTTMIMGTVNTVNAYVLLDWDLVDSGKHLDWKGTTAYSTAWNSGVGTWNAQKNIIRPDAWNRVNDLVISDYTETGTTTVAYCSSAGYIKFNTTHMSGYSADKREHVVVHELGHALGIAHNDDSTSIMYPYVNSQTTLSQDDINALDWLYNYKY